MRSRRYQLSRDHELLEVQPGVGEELAQRGVVRRVECLEPLAHCVRDRGGVVPLVLVRRVRYIERIEPCATRSKRNAR